MPLLLLSLLLRLWTWAKTHVRLVLTIVTIILTFLLGWYAHGPTHASVTSSATSQVLYRDRDVIRTVQVSTESKAHVVVRDHTVVKYTDRVVYRDVETTSDGSSASVRAKVSESKEAERVTQTTSSTVKVSDAPRWTIQAGAGIDLAHLSKPAAVYGGSVSYRVIGPFSVGAFGYSNGVGGLVLGVSF